MESSVKIIISGLDNAGKTSILTALDKKYDFQKEISELKPTIRIEYHQTKFLGNQVHIWDMGGQSQYREVYEKRRDIYFEDTDLLMFIIDIQDEPRFKEALEYLDMVLSFFIENKIDVPVIISFNKFDPDIRGEEEINNRIIDLRQTILDKYPHVKTLFQQTSIYDIISVVQLISYGLSVFDKRFFELSELLEMYLEQFSCASLILFDENGIIISEFYSDEISSDLYIELLESIKEHLFLLKRMQEEKAENEFAFFSTESKFLSYLHKVKFGEIPLFISILVEEAHKDKVMDKFTDLVDELMEILMSLGS